MKINRKNSGVSIFKVNGKETKDKCIKLQDDGNIYEIKVEMWKKSYKTIDLCKKKCYYIEN